MRLLIITPIFRPSVGGAATYYDLLSSGLIDAGIVDSVVIVTEAVPGQSSRTVECAGKLTVVRLFPHRAGTSMHLINQYAKYAAQNFTYFLLPKIVRSEEANIVLAHSSFHNHLGVYSRQIKRMKKYVPVIADCRDQQLSVSRLWHLDIYDQIVAASQNVKAHLEQRAALHSRIRLIPVLQERLEFDDFDCGMLPSFVEPGRFILFAGLIKAAKGLDLLLDSYAFYKQISGDPMVLVIAGEPKDKSIAKRAKGMKGVRLVGSLARTQLLTLIKNAALNVSLSSSEGMPRACLEAIALGTRVLLPPGIPEFEKFCGNSIARSKDPRVIAEQMVRLLGEPPARGYPIENHAPEDVLNQYAKVFQSALHRERV